MCLKLFNDSKIVVADKDIICYKILKKDSEICATSPFFEAVYKVGETYRNKKKPKIRGQVCRFVIEGIYSFGQFQSAFDYLRIWQKFLPGCFVYKCIIPKGTMMVDGYFSGFYAIVSEAIKIIEEVQS